MRQEDFLAKPIGLPKRWRTARKVRSIRSYTLVTNSGVDSIVIMSWFPSERERQLKHSPTRAAYAQGLCLPKPLSSCRRAGRLSMVLVYRAFTLSFICRTYCGDIL